MLKGCMLCQHAQAWHALNMCAKVTLLQSGNWDDVSGETFLRGLLSRGIEVAKYSVVIPRLTAAHIL